MQPYFPILLLLFELKLNLLCIEVQLLFVFLVVHEQVEGSYEDV